MIVFDYLAVNHNKEPRFCISHKVVKHSNNRKVEICNGVAYKYQKYYENEKITATEFGPFFIKDRFAEEN